MIQPAQDQFTRRRAPLVRRFFRAEIAIPAIALVVLTLVSTPHLTRASDSRQDSLATTTARLQDVIDRFRQRTSNQYDPIAEGWTPLVNAGYLAAIPTNPVTGSSLVTSNPSAASGWTFNAISGHLDACIIDGATGEVRLLRGSR